MSAIADVVREFRLYRQWAESAMGNLDDAGFFRKPAPPVNPVALIVKHVAGNLKSRWSDLLSSDGEKPTRNREREFRLDEQDTRQALMAAWEQGWTILFDTLQALDETDLESTITIRGEPHTVRQALLRAVSHVAYHTGQILYIVRMMRPDAPWLTIAPGQSSQRGGDYLRRTEARGGDSEAE